MEPGTKISLPRNSTNISIFRAFHVSSILSPNERKPLQATLRRKQNRARKLEQQSVQSDSANRRNVTKQAKEMESRQKRAKYCDTDTLRFGLSASGIFRMPGVSCVHVV